MSQDKRLTRDACRAYLDETTFRLRPKDYGEKYPKWPGAVGLEIEMLPVFAAQQGPAPGVPKAVPLHSGPIASARIIRELAQKHGYETVDTEDDHGQTMLLRVGLDENDNYSFEPGGQIEFSSRPYPCLSEAIRRMKLQQQQLDEALAVHGIRFMQMGINPWHTVGEIGLQMPKGRYRAMDRHFANIGEYGQRMMRQTCTVQVNLDFGPTEETLTRRYLGSQLLAPIAAATFACSPVVDRHDYGINSFRTRVWRHSDDTRTGVPGLLAKTPAATNPERLTRAACVDSYLEFVLGATVVFVTDLDYKVPAQRITFGEWLGTPIEGVFPKLDDLIVHLSLMFPEVRPRGFLELRSIDCQPRAFQAVPAAYMTGLLYNDRALGRLLDQLLPIKNRVPDLLVRAEQGLKDPELALLARQVMDIAVGGFQALSSCFKADGTDATMQRFREHFTEQARTPADDLVLAMQQSGAKYLTTANYLTAEARWSEVMQSHPADVGL